MGALSVDAKSVIAKETQKLNVVVLNWRNYLDRGDEYVHKMRNMASRHLTIPHKFVEITEYELPEKGRFGWFNKLTLLDMFDDEVLYFDLDVIISQNVDHLVELGRSDPTKLWARNDYSYPVSLNSKVVGDGFAGPLMENGREATINSSVMYWQGRRKVARRDGVHGDQGCITAALWPDGIALFPDESIKSWKYHVGRGLGYGDVTVFHGEPKPHQVESDPFVRDHWR